MTPPCDHRGLFPRYVHGGYVKCARCDERIEPYVEPKPKKR